jgi:hypothetical protein
MEMNDQLYAVATLPLWNCFLTVRLDGLQLHSKLSVKIIQMYQIFYLESYLMKESKFTDTGAFKNFHLVEVPSLSQ